MISDDKTEPPPHLVSWGGLGFRSHELLLRNQPELASKDITHHCNTRNST